MIDSRRVVVWCCQSAPVATVNLINSISVLSKNNESHKLNYLSLFPSSSNNKAFFFFSTLFSPLIGSGNGELMFRAMFLFPPYDCNLVCRSERKWQNLVITIGNKSFMFNVTSSSELQFSFSIQSCDLGGALPFYHPNWCHTLSTALNAFSSVLFIVQFLFICWKTLVSWKGIWKVLLRAEPDCNNEQKTDYHCKPLWTILHEKRESSKNINCHWINFALKSLTANKITLFSITQRHKSYNTLCCASNRLELKAAYCVISPRDFW